MKKGFLKKLAICLSLGLGVMTLAACQSTDQNQAAVVPQQTVCNLISKREAVGDQVVDVLYVQAGIAIANNTIYDAKTWYISYEITYKIGESAPSVYKDDSPERALYVVHGAAGYLGIEAKLDDELQPYIHPNVTVASVKITGGKAVTFANLWESYIGWWIAAIVIVGVALIFFAAELFGKHLSKNQIVDLFKGHVTSSCVFAMFMLIICLFPLIFGAWFSTIILLIALAGSFVGGGALALIAFAAAKE